MSERCVFPQVLLISLSLLSVSCPTLSAELYTKISSDNYTPAVPVNDFFGSWKGAKSFKAADSAYANHIAEFGVNYDQWSFGVFARLDYYIDMHPEVGEYRYLFHNARDQLEDKNYVYDFSEQRLVSEGIRIGYTFALPEDYEHIKISTSLNLLHSSIFQNREISDGYINGKTRLGDADAVYHFNEDTLYTLLNVPKTPNGYGAALDLALSYKYSWRLIFGVEAKDLFHFVRFDESPYARGNFRFNDYFFDKNDIRNQLPLIDLVTHESGNYESFTMNLPERVRVFANYRLKYKWSIEASVLNINNDNFYTVKTTYIPKRGVSYGVSIEPKTSSIGFHYANQNFEASLVSDDIKYSYANRINLYLGYKWEW